MSGPARTTGDLDATPLTDGPDAGRPTTAIYQGAIRVDVDVRPVVELPISRAALARAVVAALAAGQAPTPASIGLILTDDAEIAVLNEAHMGVAGPTDVLSFPLLAPEAYPPHAGQASALPTPGPIPGVQGVTRGAAGPGLAAPGFALPPGRRIHLGDIVVSVERVADQAAQGRGGQTGDVRWSPADELRLLVTHGALHLCGWDHAEPAEEAAMRALEQELLGRS